MIDERKPRRGRGHQAMHDEHDGLVRIERLQPRDARGGGEFRRMQQARQSEFLRVHLHEHHRERRGEVRREREGALPDAHGFLFERIFDARARSASPRSARRPVAA